MSALKSRKFDFILCCAWVLNDMEGNKQNA